MRLVEVRCPKCGAGVSVSEGAATASCEYCGTQSAVSRRTRFLERKIPVRAPVRGNAPKMPVAVQRHTRKWIAWMVMVPFAVAAVGALALGAVKAKQALSKDYWGGGHPMVGDVNGDGVGDPVGLVRILPGDDTTHYVAFDGKTGDELWRTPSLGTFSDIQQGKDAIVGAVLIHASPTGIVMGIDIAKGTIKWKGTSLGEKPERICAENDSMVFIDTADKRRVSVNLSDGHKVGEVAIERKTPCAPLWSRMRNSQAGVFVNKWPYADEPKPRYLGEVMDVDWTLRNDAGLRVAVGTKKEGTNVPHVGAYRQNGELLEAGGPNDGLDIEMLWASEVPAHDPLGADTGAPDHVALNGTHVYVGYETKKDDIRVAAFELKTGKRLFDIAAPRPERGSHVLAGVAVDGDNLLLSTWSSLFVLDRTSGSIRFRVGL